MLEDVVPDEAGRGIRERIIAERVAAAEPAERFLEVIGDVPFGAPGMSVGGVDAVALEVVQQDVLFRQGMVVGGNEARVDA